MSYVTESGDLDKSMVSYRLTSPSPDLQDSFVFDLMDSRPNVLPNNVFHVKWSEVSLGRPMFNVSETEGVLRVPVVRTGNLKQVRDRLGLETSIIFHCLSRVKMKL